MTKVEYLKVGRFLGTHGIRGEVRVFPDTDFPEERFTPGKVLFLQHPSLPSLLSLTIEKSRFHKQAYLVKFHEWNNINQAEPYKGGTFVVPETDLVAVEEAEGEYYFRDIIGCEVITTDGRVVGTVNEILPLPANDVWVVRGENRKEILIPYIEDIVKQVDVSKKQIMIEWMEGLE